MSESNADFLNALGGLDHWGNHFFATLLVKHWIQPELTLLAYSRSRKGVLTAAEELAVRHALQRFGESAYCERFSKLLVTSYGINKNHADQFLHVTQGVLHGVLAAHSLQQWSPSSKGFPAEANDVLSGCLHHYHAAWDLYSSRFVTILGHAASSPDPDRATAFLNAFAKGLPSSSPVEWTEANWLLVRRLLAWVTGDDPSPVGATNRVHMLLVSTDQDRQTRGLTAPVQTAAYPEGIQSAYLDPVALGVTILDDDMLNSLRIASRIARPLLQRMPQGETALRIGPQPGAANILLLTGASAGGLVTVAACATAQGDSLNADCTASFTVDVERAILVDMKANPASLLTLADVRFGAVDSESIEAKLTSPPFVEAHLRTVFLHHEQSSGEVGKPADWSTWTSRLKQDQNLHIHPVSADMKLADVIQAMTGDAQLERLLTQHADAVFAEWQSIKAVTSQDPNSQQDEQDEHRFDRYVWPGYHIEKPEVERERKERIQEQGEPKSVRVCGRREERIHNLLRRLIRKGKSLVVYDKAGAGKTVFSWRARHEIASPRMRRELFAGNAPLVVRCDGTWPTEPTSGRLLTLTETLERELLPSHSDRSQVAAVVAYALQKRRVILILDGFDQFSEVERKHVEGIMTSKVDHTARNQCHWIITSRVHTIDALRHTLFVDKDWTRVRIDPFTPKQQDRYFRDLGDRWLETVPDREAVADLLALPLILRMIRRVIDETKPGEQLPVFHTLSELFVVSSRMLLQRAIEKSQNELKELASGRLKPDEQLRLLEQVLSLLAFQMLLDENYNGLLDDGRHREIKAFEERAQIRFCYELNTSLEADRLLPASVRKSLDKQLNARLDEWDWAIRVLKTIELNHRSVTEAYQPQRIAFRSRKVLECYAARYLTNYATDSDRIALQDFLGDAQWNETWSLAIQMPTCEIDPQVISAAFQVLFAVPPRHPRPTEHMFHAWQLMTRDPERYPGLEETMQSYRQQFRDILSGEAPVPTLKLSAGAEEPTRLNRAQRAAELICEEDLNRLSRELRSPVPGWWEQIKPKHAAHSLCSNGTSQSLLAKASTDTKRLSFLIGASPEDDSATEDEKYAASDKESRWVERTIPAFQMATCCVTRAQYRLFDPRREQENQTGDSGKERRSPEEDCPMTYVDWFDSYCFAMWLGEGYELPTEEQWEGAAWGGINRASHRDAVISVPPYHVGFTSSEVNHNGNHPIAGQKKSGYLERTLPVRWDADRQKRSDITNKPDAYQPNGFGLWQVNGNVYEWCGSGWEGNLQLALERMGKMIAGDEVGKRTFRVVRGGSCDFSVRSSRTSHRLRFNAESRSNSVGFRLSRTR